MKGDAGLGEGFRHMSISKLKAKSSAADPVQRFEMFTEAGGHRTWSPQEKARIVAESHAARETECSVARPRTR